MSRQNVVIHPGAEVHESVQIGSFTVIGDGVKIGKGCRIGSNVVISGATVIGENNVIDSHASIGGDPQHLEYAGEKTLLTIGDNNTFREFVTINRAYDPSGQTAIGSHNYFMCQSHVAHDCHIGNHVVFANFAAVAGFVEVADHAFLSPFTGVHQHCRIGEYAFLGRATKVGKDILPYMLVTGVPGSLHSVNLVGLKRHGFDDAVLRELKKALHVLTKEHMPLEEFKAYVSSRVADCPAMDLMLQALQKSQRGIAR